MTARPRGAPGPSDNLLYREDRARRRFADARERLDAASPGDAVAAAQRHFESAIDDLAKVKEELLEAKVDVENYPVPDYLKSAYNNRNVMVAVTGSSGVGKSSFINVVRRMRPKDAGAAKTGITETTMKPTMFTYPSQRNVFRRTLSRAAEMGRSVGRSLWGRSAPREEAFQVGEQVLISSSEPALGNETAEVVAQHGTSSWDVRLGDGRIVSIDRSRLAGVPSQCVFWDLPGVGTPNYPQATYLREMGIRYFDVVVLMTATRFTEAELMLVEELRRWNVPFFLVRNKADADVRAEIEAEEDAEGEDLSEERRKEVELETLQTIRDYFKAELGLDRVYCISSRIRLADQYDLELLERDLEESMSHEALCDRGHTSHCLV